MTMINKNEAIFSPVGDTEKENEQKIPLIFPIFRKKICREK